jgi:hypothetical protein
VDDVKTPVELGHVHLANEMDIAHLRMDYIVIYPMEYYQEAKSLCTHRDTFKMDDVELPRLIDVQAVYDMYACGLQVPTAIRDFLKQIYYSINRRDPPPLVLPSYVVLFGDGYFNYKLYNTSEKNLRNFIPPFESSGDDNLGLIPSGSDDYYVDLDTTKSDALNFMLGRLPAENVAEARVMVEKIKSFDNYRDEFGWRNIHTLIADDGKQGEWDDNVSNHVRDMEAVFNSMGTSWEFMKIYLFDYPLEGFQKPRAADDIINRVNQGTFTLNFVGHGASGQWSDENIMRIETVSRMRNRDKYFFSWTASCGTSEFDMPAPTKCLGEYLLKVSDCGAVGTVGGVRSTFANHNINLMKAFYNSMHGMSLGQILVNAKNAVSTYADILNTKKHVLLGDPATMIFRDLRQTVMAIERSGPSILDAVNTVDSSLWDSLSAEH